MKVGQFVYICAAPNTLVWEKLYDPIRLDEDTIRAICNKKFYIYLVNTDDMKIREEVLLDFSCLLCDKREQPEVILPYIYLTKFIYENSKSKIMEIENFRFRLSCDKVLL